MFHLGEPIHNSENAIKTFGGWKINNKILRDTLHGPLGIGKGQTNPYGQCRGHLEQQHASQLRIYSSSNTQVL